jgi:hypothetical protein
VLTEPKNGRARSVPLAPAVAAALAQLGQRARWTREDDLVFVGELGGYSTALRCGAAMSARSIAPGCGVCASTTSAIRSARA